MCLARKMISMSFASVAVLMVLLLAGCSSGGSGESGDQQKSPTTPVEITINCDSNLLFSTYDVDVYVDEESQGKIDHGASRVFTVDLADGEHTLRLTEAGNSSVDGEVSFVVPDKTSLRYDIHCTNSQVQIEEVSTVNPPLSSSEVVGMDKDDVEVKFKEAGFSSVSLQESRDLSIDQRDKANMVSAVTVAGKGSFDGDDEFYPDEEVVVTFRLPEDVAAPIGADEAKGRQYAEIAAQFEDAGFVNVATEVSNGANLGGIGNEVSHISIHDGGLLSSSDFAAGDKFPYDAEVKIEYYLPQEEARSDSGGSHEPSEWELVDNAKDIFERWGEAIYPYGFKCHWIMDLVAQEVNPDGSVYLKVGVTVENAFGNTIRTYAAGTVRGATVENFYVG